jgi:RNA polymerase sigma-70 factor (ECF subfamily)
MKIVGSEEVAQDILQDTFVKVWKQFSTYDQSKGRLFTWILNLARNRAIDYTRSSAFKNELRNQFEELETKTSEMSETSVDQIGLSEVMELLQPEVQEALEVVYFKGYSHKEASEYLNIPLGTVKTRVRNGLIDLRKVIK